MRHITSHHFSLLFQKAGITAFLIYDVLKIVMHLFFSQYIFQPNHATYKSFSEIPL